MIESDWKKFRAMIPQLREHYLAERNARIARILADPTKTETERFWDTLEAMQKEATTLRMCLNDHSRSKMTLALIIMRGAGMLTKDDLAGFSPELQKEVFHDLLGKNG